MELSAIIYALGWATAIGIPIFSLMIGEAIYILKQVAKAKKDDGKVDWDEGIAIALSTGLLLKKILGLFVKKNS